mgnify:FL=1
MKTPRVICITGGIGSGKSTLCKLLESRGYAVYYSDERAKQLMSSQMSLVRSITNLFGESAYDSGILNRAFISSCIFKQEYLKVELESLVHPIVKEDFINWSADIGEPIVFKESALVLETNDDSCHFVISIMAEESLRIKRVKQRSPALDETRIKEIILSQHPDHLREKHSHLVIENNGTLNELELQVDYLISKVI